MLGPFTAPLLARRRKANPRGAMRLRGGGGGGGAVRGGGSTSRALIARPTGGSGLAVARPASHRMIVCSVWEIAVGIDAMK